ncbi:MAG: sterol desaturase family protein [Novosphingobium sp.]|nr:sterol desaturase family protein [Novosphingobium sp.]
MAESTSQAQQVQLFRHAWLERLTVITPVGFAITWAILMPLLVWLAWGSANVLQAAVLGLAGLMFWGIFEYVIHRYSFHWKPKSKLFQSFVYIMHGNHHDVPNDPLRNLMPPIASIPITGSVWLLFIALFGFVSTWAFIGFLVGYIVYDMLHYACHQWPMKSRLWLPFKKHHMRHHFGANEGNYAITALFLDRVMGSRVESLKAER